MRILILGGTRFLGRHIVQTALARGHEMTLFHRGENGKELFEGQVERLLGDRTQDLSALSGGRWDAVVDTCGYVPREVGKSAGKVAEERLAPTYLFVSSISVLKDPVAGADESWPVATMDDPTIEEINGETYGPLKALCEDVVREAFPEGHIVVRPGLIVGPNDPTDRFTYWPWRMAQGGDVLVPARRDQPVQIIDVRDLAAWCVSALEQGLSGTYSLAAPEEPYALGNLLETLRDGINPQANLVWVDPAKLAEWEVGPWMELPLYLGAEAEADGMMAVSIRKALDTGLTTRGLPATAEDTLEWARTRPAEYVWRAGLTPKREQDLLAMWWS